VVFKKYSTLLMSNSTHCIITMHIWN